MDRVRRLERGDHVGLAAKTLREQVGLPGRGSRDRLGLDQLDGRRRASIWCVAFQTSPMPPWPIGDSSR